MIMSLAKGLKIPNSIVFLTTAAKKVLKSVMTFRPGDILSDDAKYKLNFYKCFLPELYKAHINKNYSNCVFCSNLVKSGCHKYCLKCSIGTYIKCCPPLPGLLYKETIYTDDKDTLPLPWYFKKTCRHFSRLPQSQYFRNLYSLFPSIAINNYEVLEGLENGLLSGVRPCYVCASVNYDLYRTCAAQYDFDMYKPCCRIKRELKKTYTAQTASIKSAV